MGEAARRAGGVRCSMRTDTLGLPFLAAVADGAYPNMLRTKLEGEFWSGVGFFCAKRWSLEVAALVEGEGLFLRFWG
jgi:hypothetical protein